MKKKDNSIDELKLIIEELEKDIYLAQVSGKPFFASRLAIIRDRKQKKLDSWINQN